MMNEVQIRIGIRWNHSSIEVILRETERFLDWLHQFESSALRGNEKIPVLWNIASFPFLEMKTRNLKDLVSEIRTRVRNNNDNAVSMGYSGSVHPLLTIPELQKECEWGLSNPYGSGINDIFRKETDIIIPSLPDIWRKEAAACYGNARFRKIGINAHTLDQLGYKNMNSLQTRNVPDSDEGKGDAVSCFSFFPLSPQILSYCRKDIKKTVDELNHSFCFFYDCSHVEEVVKNPFDFRQLSEFIEILMSKYKVLFPLPDHGEWNLKTGNIPKENDRDIFPNNPLWRFHTGQAAGLTENRRNPFPREDDDIKTILSALRPLAYITPDKSGNKGGRESTANEIKSDQAMDDFPPDDRINNADMQGAAILTGNIFSVHFSGGRIEEIVYRNRRLLPEEKPVPYLTFSGERHQPGLIGAFSISGDRCRGLREIRNITVNEDESHGTKLTDYIFVEDFPYLIVTSKVSYPFLPGDGFVDESALFHMPLFHLNPDTKCELTVYSGSSYFTCGITPVEQCFTQTGQAFVFSQEGISFIIGFPAEKARGLNHLGIKIEKSKKGFLLSVNINGNYYPAPAYCFSRINEIFTFYLGINPILDGGIPSFPEYVLSEIPENRVRLSVQN